MMRTVDVLYSLPSIIFVIVIITTLEGVVQGWSSRRSAVMGRNPRHLFVVRRTGRGVVADHGAHRARAGVGAARAAVCRAARSLASAWTILWRHILPNVFGVVIVYLTLTLPAVVLYESFLSYLGLGIQRHRRVLAR